MEIVHEEKDLERYMREAVKVSNDSPVLLDRFLNDAIEVDVDALCDGSQVLIGGIMEHIEQAGVHSGDSACSLPPHTLPLQVISELRTQAEALAKGENPPSYDKQFVRDWLEQAQVNGKPWDKTAPSPRLPQAVIEKTAAKDREALERLTR